MLTQTTKKKKKVRVLGSPFLRIEQRKKISQKREIKKLFSYTILFYLFNFFASYTKKKKVKIKEKYCFFLLT